MVGSSSFEIKRGAVVVAVAAGALVGVAAPASTTPAHRCQPAIKDLGDPFRGHFSFADGVNSGGTVAGTAMLPNGLGRAVVWQGGRARNLGVVGKYDESFAHGIADDGTVVGELDFHQTEAAPFIYSHGHMRQLPGLGGDFGYAAAINNQGVIAGTASDASGNPHAVAWTDDGRKVHDLGIAKGDASSFGSGLNGANVVVGDTDTAGGNERPAVYDHGVVVLSPSQGKFGAAEDINAHGRVVGLSFLPSGKQHATVWGPLQRRGRDLGTLPGGTFASLVDVDDHGRAAGGGDIANNPGLTKAIVWPGNGPLLALRPLSRRFQDDFAVARKLGAQGQAVGASQNPSGDIRATVWTCAFQQAFRPDGHAHAGGDGTHQVVPTPAESKASSMALSNSTIPAPNLVR
jgi:probable HAF family extracellular repeat protein